MDEPVYKNLSLEDLPGEEWRDVVGYEGLYKVSNLGRVKSLDRIVNNNGGKRVINKKIMCQQSNGNGYLIVQFCKNNHSVKKYVHRLVCEAFIGKIGDLEINHIDKCKSNNNVDNLEICTRSYNYEYSKDDILAATQRKCYMYDENGVFVKEYQSITEAARDNKLSLSTIIGSCTSHRKKGSKIHFRYEQTDNIDIQDRKRRKIWAYNINGDFVREYKSATEAAELLCVKENTIVCACCGKIKTCKGYILKYR